MFNPFSAAVSAAGFAVNAGSKVIQIVGKRSNKAKLVLNPSRGINPILIHCFIADTNSPVVHPDGRGYKIPYLVNRVAIKNNGKWEINKNPAGVKMLTHFAGGFDKKNNKYII